MDTTHGPHKGFFYGTLMAPRVLSRVCFGAQLPNSTTTRLAALTFTPALLRGYQRHRVRGADYPGIVAREGAEVRGTLVAGLTEGDVWRLDMFEGDEYVRRKVRVVPLGRERAGLGANAESGLLPPPSSEGVVEGELEEVEAETYVWIAGIDALEQAEWDFDEFVKEKMWRWVGDAAEQQGEYSEVDRVVAHEAQQSTGSSQIEDPTRGRGMNGSISKALSEGIS